MVRITKPPKHNTTILYKKTLASISLCLLLWIGIHWFSWFVALISSNGSSQQKGGAGGGHQYKYNDMSHQLRRDYNEQPLPRIKGVPQPKPQRKQNHVQPADPDRKSLQEQTESILSKLHQLSTSTPLIQTDANSNSNNSNNKESKFISTIRKECIPGRDDSSTGEINPTTHRKRECLRHVPLGKKRKQSSISNNDPSDELQERIKLQKPRIAIMISPGFISTAFANWISAALKVTSNTIHMDIDVIITSHVPVYGYGKSHGYTKLIRFISLPLVLAAVDAYAYGVSKGNMLGSESQLMTEDTLGKMVQLIMRWHCRISREYTKYCN